MTSHDDEDLASIASSEGQEESRRSSSSSAEPDESWFLLTDQISYKSPRIQVTMPK